MIGALVRLIFMSCLGWRYLTRPNYSLVFTKLILRQWLLILASLPLIVHKPNEVSNYSSCNVFFSAEMCKLCNSGGFRGVKPGLWPPTLHILGKKLRPVIP